VCPSAPELRCGYAYNRTLGGRNLGHLTDPAVTVCLFESDLSWNGDGGVGDLATQPRHWGVGDNWAFADGHVDWCRRPATDLIWRPQGR